MVMQEKAEQMLDVLQIAGLFGERVYAWQISNAIGISKQAVYTVAWYLRFHGFGIENTYRGYVLSEFATQTEDYRWGRRMLRQRERVSRLLEPCLHDMQSRTNDVDILNMLVFLHDAPNDQIRDFYDIAVERVL